MRKPIIAGNWKMNKTPQESKKFMEEIISKIKDAKCEVVIIPPFTSLCSVLEVTKGTSVKVGAQNMYFKESGAFTGEVSPLMLKEMGVEYVVIGHSERREYFKEDDELLNNKVKSAFEHELTPILCVGETLSEREEGNTFTKIEGQIEKDLKGLKEEQIEKMVIAYEPIWAIGTGKTATSQQANEVIKFIRNTVKKLFGEKAAEKVRIQYGGSVKPATIKEQMAQSDIDGALVGGASLKVEDFASIVNF